MDSIPTVYPPSHEKVLERVMRVIDLIAARPNISEEELVAALSRDGVDEVDAELLVRFVPCAFAFAFLKFMGLSKLPSAYQVRNAAEQWVELPLAAEHYFLVALGIGCEVTTCGYTEQISKRVFEAVLLRSAEMNVVNQYFKTGGTPEGLASSTLGPPTLIGITAEQIGAGR
jgi:hypothetical protein